MQGPPSCLHGAAWSWNDHRMNLHGRRLFLAGMAAVSLAGCGRGQAVRGQAVARGAKVLALGDSLTYGTGATPETAYPAVLAESTGWDVVNAGVPGHTTAQALERLPALLDEHRPALVLVSIGGNDFLRRQPEDAARAAIVRICEQVRGAGAQVLLIAVPRPTLAARFTGSLDDHPMYEAIAAELKLPLHARGWADVLQDESLRADAIHANAAGYRRFADGLAKAARSAGLLPAK
jgi:acyl-CoA thioesterase I